MNETLLAGLTGAGATVLAALVTVFGKDLADIRKRKELGYPDLKGYWKAEWYLDGMETIYLEDVVHISSIKGKNIYGEGINSEKGNYPLTGKLSKNLVLNFIYESGKTYISLSGVVILKIDAMGCNCTGRWYGYTREDKMTGGNVFWRKI